MILAIDPSPRAVQFDVPGVPVGKGRPIAGKAFGGGHTTLRTPAKTLNYEAVVALAGQQGMRGRPLFDEALRVSLDIRLPIPESWSRKKRAAAEAGTLRPTSKPDIDNVEKAIFDGLNGVAWRDDVLVVEVSKAKRYSLLPGVTVEIEPIAQEPA